MAASLLFLDSMRHYNTAAQLAKKYATVANPGSTWSVEATGGPTNGPHILRQDTAGSANINDYIAPRLSRRQSGAWTPTVAGLIGFHFKVDDFSKFNDGATNNEPFVRLFDGSTEMHRLRLNANGAFNAERVNSAISFTSLGTSANVIEEDTWHHFQLKWDLLNASGRVAVRIDRTTVLDSGLVDSLGQGATVNAIRLLALDGTAVSPFLRIRMANLFVYGMAAFADQINGLDWLDDRTVGFRAVTGDGASVGWTPSAGDNFENVDDAAPDDDATYNAATTNGTNDLFTVDNVPAGVTPDGQQIVAYVRREADGAAAAKPLVRHNGSTEEEAEQGIADETYGYLLHPMDVNPETAAAETEATANASQYGLQKSG